MRFAQWGYFRAAALVGVAMVLSGNVVGQTIYQPKKPVYKVQVKTSDRSGAGTDSNIDMTMSSNSGSYKVRLNPLMSGNAFERNDTDTCDISVDSGVGHPTTLLLKSDTSYAGSDWHVEWVKITSPDGHVQTFSFNKWIEDDSSNDSLTATAAAPDKPWSMFQIEVQTADMADAGTDSNIHLTLFGQDNQIGEFRATSWVSGNAWERGDVDKFTVWVDANVDTVRGIKVVSDGMYAAADWRLHLIKIKYLKSNQVDEFLYDRWITDSSPVDQQIQLSQRIRNLKFTPDGATSDTITQIKWASSFGEASDTTHKFSFSHAVQHIAEITNSRESTVGTSTTISAGHAASDAGGFESQLIQEFSSSLTEAGANLSSEEVSASVSEEKEFTTPKNSLLIVVCTWEIPLDTYRASDGTGIAGARVVSGAPAPNLMSLIYSNGQSVPKDYWKKLESSMQPRDWEILKGHLAANQIALGQ